MRLEVFFIRLMGSAMFLVEFLTWLHVLGHRNLLNTESWKSINCLTSNHQLCSQGAEGLNPKSEAQSTLLPPHFEKSVYAPPNNCFGYRNFNKCALSKIVLVVIGQVVVFVVVVVVFILIKLKFRVVGSTNSAIILLSCGTYIIKELLYYTI